MNLDESTPFDGVVEDFEKAAALAQASEVTADLIAGIYNGLVERGLPHDAALQLTLQQMYLAAIHGRGSG